MRENFEKLANRNDWKDPDSDTSPNKFTIHRQKQLKAIFDLYGGSKIPFSHFTDEIVRDSEKRNSLAFPAVFAYICGILKIQDDGLIKPDDLILGEKDLSRNGTFWV